MWASDDRGQIYTIEGFAAALILIGFLIIIFQSISVVTPQTEKSTDMKLGQIASDTLICVDRTTEDYGSDLKVAVAGWEGNSATYADHVDPAEAGIQALDARIGGMLNDDVGYRVDVIYYSGTAMETVPIIVHGIPGDNSVVADRMVSLNTRDTMSGYWKSIDRFPLVVDVRMTCWYL